MTKKTSFFIILLAGIFLFNPVFSQENGANNKPSAVVQERVSLEVKNAVISNQKGNVMDFSFDLASSEKFYPEISYGITLLEVEEGNVKTIEERNIESGLSVGPRISIHLEKEYMAPSYLNGDYRLMLTIRSENGSVLAIARLGEVTLAGSGEFVEIVNNSCYLKVEGEESEIKYNTSQGVAVKAEENLMAVCEVKNNFKTSQSLIPYFETRYRNVFGEKVKGEKLAKLELAPGDKKTLSFIFSKTDQPQAYDAVLSFIGKDGMVVSNEVAFHYVLHGKSATIQNLGMDKQQYKKGETAIVKFTWTGAADSFPNERLAATNLGKITAEVGIMDDKSVLCANNFTQELSSQNNQAIENKESLNVAILSDCVNPKVSLTLRDESGQVLASTKFKIESGKVKENEDLNSQSESKSIYMIVLTVFSLITVILMLLILKYKYDKKNLN